MSESLTMLDESMLSLPVLGKKVIMDAEFPGEWTCHVSPINIFLSSLLYYIGLIFETIFLRLPFQQGFR